MANNRRSNFVAAIFMLYRNNFGLFWRIMIPVVIIAILLHIAMFFRSVNVIEKHFGNQPDHTATANLNTFNGINPSTPIPDNLFRTFEDTSKDLSSNGVKGTRSSPFVSWQFFPVLNVSTMDGKTAWQWTLHFQIYDYYTPLILMLLTLCPLSLVIARLSSNSRLFDVPSASIPLTAGGAWRQTGKKAFTVLLAAVLFVLIADVGNNIYFGIQLLIPSFIGSSSATLIFILAIFTNIYFLVTLSLYNPCLILEKNSLIDIFRRSHALVSGARLRFLWIYLLTGWIAAVFTSVLLGVVLLLFSVFFSELTPIREALTPLKFLSLFVGGNVGVMLPKLPGILPTVLLLIVRGLIFTFLVPVWAVVTTHLYLEKVEMIPETEQEA